jgi:hypothetical protein
VLNAIARLLSAHQSRLTMNSRKPYKMFEMLTAMK